MARIVGKVARVVDTGVLAIDELAGNVATKNDQLSIAYVTVSEKAEEPWLTLHYDEWICVRRGRVVLDLDGGSVLEVSAGETVFIPSGTHFRPRFPDAGTEYIPVCSPAFRPDRCIREDGDSEVASRLKELHGGAAQPKEAPPNNDAGPEILYHMCQKDIWEEAKRSGHAYFPPTFEKDGFTHGTAVPARLLDTANHFYQDVKGDWLCLQFRRSALKRLGIITKDEKPMAVGDKQSDKDFESWVCPHIFGGIPPQVVELEFPMLRDGPRYSCIAGLTEMPKFLYKLATSAEVATFKEKGSIASDLDTKDGFVHLSDARAAPIIAGTIFTHLQPGETFCVLKLEVDRLPSSMRWTVGQMGGGEPGAVDRSSVQMHYLVPDGCAHYYSDQGLPFDAVASQDTVEVGQDGSFTMPTLS